MATSTADAFRSPAFTLSTRVGNTGFAPQHVSSKSHPPVSAAMAAPALLLAAPWEEKMLPTAFASLVTNPVQFHSPRNTVAIM